MNRCNWTFEYEIFANLDLNDWNDNYWKTRWRMEKRFCLNDGLKVEILDFIFSVIIIILELPGATEILNAILWKLHVGKIECIGMTVDTSEKGERYLYSSMK